jgi:hypothetical protein
MYAYHVPCSYILSVPYATLCVPCSTIYPPGANVVYAPSQTSFRVYVTLVANDKHPVAGELTAPREASEHSNSPIPIRPYIHRSVPVPLSTLRYYMISANNISVGSNCKLQGWTPNRNLVKMAETHHWRISFLLSSNGDESGSTDDGETGLEGERGGRGQSWQHVANEGEDARGGGGGGGDSGGSTSSMGSMDIHVSTLSSRFQTVPTYVVCLAVQDQVSGLQVNKVY